MIKNCQDQKNHETIFTLKTEDWDKKRKYYENVSFRVKLLELFDLDKSATVQDLAFDIHEGFVIIMKNKNDNISKNIHYLTINSKWYRSYHKNKFVFKNFLLNKVSDKWHFTYYNDNFVNNLIYSDKTKKIKEKFKKDWTLAFTPPSYYLKKSVWATKNQMSSLITRLTQKI